MGVGWHLLEVGQAWAETRLGAKSGPGAWLPAGGGGGPGGPLFPCAWVTRGVSHSPQAPPSH